MTQLDLSTAYDSATNSACLNAVSENINKSDNSERKAIEGYGQINYQLNEKTNDENTTDIYQHNSGNEDSTSTNLNSNDGSNSSNKHSIITTATDIYNDDKQQNFNSNEEKIENNNVTKDSIKSSINESIKKHSSGNEQVLPSVYSYNGPKTYKIPKVPIRLFVQNVPKNYEAENLRPIFEEFGVVKDVAILKDRAVNEHRGSGFVKMASLTDADAAIRALSEHKALDETAGPLQIRYATAEVEKLGIPAENAIPGLDQSRLFIGSLSRQADEEQIKGLFANICPVEEVYVIRESGSGQSRGCAFVVLANKEMALHAIKCLNGTEHLSASRPLEVRFAEIKSKGNTQQHQQVMQQVVMQPYVNQMVGNVMVNPAAPYNNYTVPVGYNNIQAPPVHVVRTHQTASPVTVSSAEANSAPRRREGWVEYFAEDGRPYYHNEILGTSQWEKPADFDTPGPPGANLFIFHVPSEWSLRELNYYFRTFGTITSATIATDKETGRNKGYGFVSYPDIQSAVAAVKAMNGFPTGTKRLKVAIKQNEENYASHLLQAASRINYPAIYNNHSARYVNQNRQFAAPY